VHEVAEARRGEATRASIRVAGAKDALTFTDCPSYDLRCPLSAQARTKVALFRVFGESVPVVALAPGGTVCTVARNLGMKRPPGAWVEVMIQSAASRTSVEEIRRQSRSA
jgi:hypothetical protein